MKIKTGKRLLLVVDANGRIIGTSPVNDREKASGPTTTIRALPGQALHEVRLTKNLEAMLKGPVDELHEALSACQLRAGPAQSILLPASPKRQRQK